MHIQPYFPEPIEVRGNVANERYAVRLSFIRAVLAGHALSVAAIVAVAIAYVPVLNATALSLFLFADLLALTLVRRFFPGKSLEGALSFLILLPTLFAVGCLVRIAHEGGAPVWLVFLSYLVASVYGALCGRDYSFVGQFVITVMALTTVTVVSVLIGALVWQEALLWWSVSTAFVFYFVYDLAALLRRRRLGEEPAAVADLYRDLLNFTTYSVRVFLHWRRFGPI